MKFLEYMGQNVKLYFMFCLLVEYILFFIAVMTGNYYIIPFFAILIIIMLSKNDTVHNLSVQLFFVTAVCALFLLNKEFVFIPQAQTLLDWDTNLLTWFKEGHVHAIRLLIAYPGYIISALCKIELNQGFSLYCVFVFTMLYSNLISVIKKLIKKIELVPFYNILCLIYCMILFMIMNGRIVFAFCGISMILKCNAELWVDGKFNFITVVKIGLGILLTTVSSGTLVVGCIVIFLGILLSKNFKGIIAKKWLWIIGVLLLPAIYIFGKYVMVMIRKNIDFFGGGIDGIINMLQHGVGRIIPLDNNILFIFFIIDGILILAVNSILIYYLYKKNLEIFPAIVAFNVAIYGSLFGLSTGTTCLVGLFPILVFLSNEKISFEGIKCLKQ